MKYSLRSLMTFSIRDLFWFTVVVAMGMAWWVDRSRLRSWLDDEEALRIESEASMAPSPERLRELRGRVMKHQLPISPGREP